MLKENSLSLTRTHLHTLSPSTQLSPTEKSKSSECGCTSKKIVFNTKKDKMRLSENSEGERAKEEQVRVRTRVDEKCVRAYFLEKNGWAKFWSSKPVRMCVSVWLWVNVCAIQSERKIVCVCVCERERERVKSGFSGERKELDVWSCQRSLSYASFDIHVLASESSR